MFPLLDFVYENCLFRQFKVNDLLFIEYKCVAEESVCKIWSQHNYFVYVLTGKKIWQTPQAVYELTEGQGIFVKRGANVVHQFFDKDFCALIILVPDDFLRDVVSGSMLSGQHGDNAPPSDSVIRLVMSPVLSAYFQSVFVYFNEDRDPPTALLDMKFRELIIDLLSSPENDVLGAYLRSLCKESRTSLNEIMESNFMYNMKLGEFARLCGRSLTGFKREFQELYKMPPGRWLMQKRLFYARHLLLTTDKNVNEIAYSSGFENPSHFIRTFRQTYDLTPLQYRKRAPATV